MCSVPPDAALIQAAMGSGLLGTPGDEGVGEFPTGPDMSKVIPFSFRLRVTFECKA